MIGIIGATGQVGSALTSLLMQNNGNFVVLARHTQSLQHMFTKNCDARHFDLEKPETFESALVGVKKLFLITTRSAHLDVLLKTALRQNIEQIVFMSGLGAQTRPTDPLGKAEIMLSNSDIHFSSLRANWFMQNFCNMFLGQIRTGILSLPAGEAKLSFVDTRDIADVALKLFNSPPEKARYFDITGPQAFSHREVVSMIAGVAEKPIVYRDISDSEARAQYHWSDCVIELFRDMKRGNSEKISNDVAHIFQSNKQRTLSNFILENAHIWKI